MSRKTRSRKRQILSDHKFNSKIVAKFINHIMLSGKKTIAEKIVYSAFAKIERVSGVPGINLFHEVLKKISPLVEVKSRRVGGSTYQVPVEVRPERQSVLAMRWLIQAARKRNEKDMDNRLALELMDARDGKGNAVRKRDEVHKMAEANRAFSSLSW